MRIVVVLAASVLVAGCSGAGDGPSRPGELTPITPSRTGAANPSATTTTTGATTGATSPTTTTATSAPPQAGAPIAEVTKWVEGAPPADAAQFHVALRGGVSTDLGEDVAFTTAAGTTCMTDARRGNPALACLVDLAEPPPRPPDVYGQWKGGWVDFDGATVAVGSAHGDPGRFGSGQGVPLPNDKSLSFGDFRCRADSTALFCVNYARQSAVRLADSGIDAYACVREVTPPAGIGIKFVC